MEGKGRKRPAKEMLSGRKRLLRKQEDMWKSMPSADILASEGTGRKTGESEALGPASLTYTVGDTSETVSGEA